MALSTLQLYQRDNYIKSSAIAGAGANQTLRSLVDIGLGMNRNNFLATYKEYSQIPGRAQDVINVPGTDLIPFSDYTLAGTAIYTDFRYTIKYTTVNNATGESFERYTRISSDNRMLMGSVMDEAAMIASQEGYWQGEEVVQMQLYESNYREGAEF